MRWLLQLVIWMYMQNYVLAMFIEIKYFIIKITVHSFVTDTEHRKLRKMMLQTSLKGSSLNMRGDKFQTTYINQMNSSLLQTCLRKNMPHWWMPTISHTHHIVYGIWNCWKKKCSRFEWFKARRGKLCVNKGENWKRCWGTFESLYTVWYDGEDIQCDLDQTEKREEWI